MPRIAGMLLLWHCCQDIETIFENVEVGNYWKNCTRVCCCATKCLGLLSIPGAARLFSTIHKKATKRVGMGKKPWLPYMGVARIKAPPE